MDFPGHFYLIFKQLNHQRLHAQLCDIVVVVGSQTFQAHRSILAACSSHFRALLSSSDDPSGGRTEGGEAGGSSVVELDPEVVTPDAFSTLLDMIYTSTLSLGTSNVMDVLLAASHLHLNAVVKACKLHLSQRNFPASAPKGWRSLQQSTSSQAAPGQQVTSASEDDAGKEEVGVEVSQSGEDERRSSSPLSLREKRKSSRERLGDNKRSCLLLGGDFKARSPTVTRSTEEGGGPSPPKRLWESQEDGEEEEKYSATKGEAEEIQLPTQSDSSTGGGAGLLKKGGEADGEPVLHIKVAEEMDDQKMAAIEVKKENTNSYSPDLQKFLSDSPQTLLQDSADGELNEEKLTAAGPTEAPALTSQLCVDVQTEALRDASELDGEGLDSLSELAFCFLNPSAESVMGALEEESLSSLTAAAVSPPSPEASSNMKSSAQPSDSSSLVFPVTSVSLQQLVPAQSSSFSEAIILQPAQSSLPGFLSTIRPALGLDASLIPSNRGGKPSALPTFRRIAPKVVPGSEGAADGSSGPDGADRPTLTRASEDVLSKCKKAAAEDHVLLVEGEKKYACRICCKTFMNLTDCKKHIRVHTGEKPYPCPKCGKRFSQSSHLYKHSKNSCGNAVPALSAEPD